MVAHHADERTGNEPGRYRGYSTVLGGSWSMQNGPELLYECLQQVIEKHRDFLTLGNLAERDLGFR